MTARLTDSTSESRARSRHPAPTYARSTKKADAKGPEHRQEAVDWFERHVAAKLADPEEFKRMQSGAVTGGDWAHGTALPGGPLARAGLIDVESYVQRIVDRAVEAGGRKEHAENSSRRALTVTPITENNIVISRLKEVAKLMQAAVQAPGFAPTPTSTRGQGLATMAAADAVPSAFGGNKEEEPNPEPIELKLSDVPKYDASWLPPGVGEWAVENAELRRAPLDFIAVSILSTVGSLVGSRVGLRPQENNPGWVEVANLRGMNVAEPGKRKSSGTSAGAGFLFALEEAATNEFLSAQKEHAKEMKRFDAKLAGANAAIKEAAKKSNGNLAEVQMKEHEAKDIEAQEPPAPVQRRFVVRKISPERLCLVLAQNPWGVMHYHDEMGPICSASARASAMTNACAPNAVCSTRRGTATNRIPMRASSRAYFMSRSPV